VFLDRDGSVTGTAGRYVAANVPLLCLTGACAPRPAWNAHVCPLAYGRLAVSSAAAGEAPARRGHPRRDGVALTLGRGEQPGLVTHVRAV
jgi:hypothetical protein